MPRPLITHGLKLAGSAPPLNVVFLLGLAPGITGPNPLRERLFGPVGGAAGVSRSGAVEILPGLLTLLPNLTLTGAGFEPDPDPDPEEGAEGAVGLMALNMLFTGLEPTPNSCVAAAVTAETGETDASGALYPKSLPTIQCSTTAKIPNSDVTEYRNPPFIMSDMNPDNRDISGENAANSVTMDLNPER